MGVGEQAENEEVGTFRKHNWDWPESLLLCVIGRGVGVQGWSFQVLGVLFLLSIGVSHL